MSCVGECGVWRVLSWCIVEMSEGPIDVTQSVYVVPQSVGQCMMVQVLAADSTSRGCRW